MVNKKNPLTNPILILHIKGTSMKIITFLPFLFTPLLLLAQKQTKMTIHFDFDKANIRPADGKLLDSLVATFPENAKNISLEIYGHCDMRGTNGYNDTLSLKRARSVKKYLLARGVKLSSITKEEGYGSRRPAATVRNSNYEIINRRVELIITMPEEKITPGEKPGEQPVEKSIEKIMDDTATKSGSTIILKNLNFEGGTHHLLNSSLPILRDLLNALKKNENLEIEIEGHICCYPDASDGYDDDTRTNNLSEERAKAIYSYLLNSGIAPERLAYKGYGHSKPIYNYPERSEQERIKNRRVEIKIRKK